MLRIRWFRSGLLLALAVIALVSLLLFFFSSGRGQARTPLPAEAAPDLSTAYVVLGWNDLGMHCYNQDFEDLAVLPPFNTLWAQVIKRGNPPQIVTQGITVTFSFADNTYSVGKSNFWDYDVPLFGVDLPPDVGLTGTGLAGAMEAKADHFVAEGIPLTEFRDSAPTTPYPYQLASIVATDTATGAQLAQSTVVAPVSTEMNCDDCHYDGGVEGIATGRVAWNILTLHDLEHLNEYPPGNSEPLMSRRPILCASCHSSNALGTPPVDDIPSLSNAMHDNHSEAVPSTLEGCYKCHPGPQTQCLRDTMSQAGMECDDCHGTMEQVAQNPEPWLLEPRCDNSACHGSGYQQDQALYRMSSDHGGVYCAGCHDSPHAIAPSTQANDWIKFLAWQGYGGPVIDCAVCHTVPPAGAGPHGLSGSPLQRMFMPSLFDD
jgi:hypothetical protein